MFSQYTHSSFHAPSRLNRALSSQSLHSCQHSSMCRVASIHISDTNMLLHFHLQFTFLMLYLSSSVIELITSTYFSQWLFQQACSVEAAAAGQSLYAKLALSWCRHISEKQLKVVTVLLRVRAE